MTFTKILVWLLLRWQKNLGPSLSSNSLPYSAFSQLIFFNLSAALKYILSSIKYIMFIQFLVPVKNFKNLILP